MRGAGQQIDFSVAAARSRMAWRVSLQPAAGISRWATSQARFEKKGLIEQFEL